MIDPVNTAALSPQKAALKEAANKMEAAFLAEMLKNTGVGQDDQFGTFMQQAQAEKMVAAGGIGLAESLFAALEAREDA